MSRITVERMSGDGPESQYIFLGGDPRSPTWAEYVDGFKEGYRDHVYALRDYIQAHDLVGVTSDRICNDTWWLFSDGTAWAFSWRAWGDLMQAIVDKREGYMRYYA